MNDEKSRPPWSDGTKQYFYESGSEFDYNLPRPPALGEETSSTVPSEWVTTTITTTTNAMDRKYTSSSPLPRYEEDIRSGQGKSFSPPACLSWAHSLRKLLQDSEGVKLFLKYLESEGPQHAKALHFWLACEGLKNPNQFERIQRLVKLIYKTYIMKSELPIKDDLRKEITRNMKSPQCLEPPITLFDEAQTQVEHLINNTTYPNFLKSDMYLQYLQSVQNPSSEEFSSESSASNSPVASTKDLTAMAIGIGPLPTLHEDMEFVNPPALLPTPGTGNVSTGYHTPTYYSGPPRLTKDMLLRSQKHRALDIRPKSETYAGLYMYRATGAHAAYNSYNPVSRQDSEMQSLSSHSDARTESDNLSISESLMDGRASGRRHRASMDAKHARESAALNKETDIHHTFIPRTQRVEMRKCPPMDFQQHAAILREKLEVLKKEKDSDELLSRRLKESDSMSSLDMQQHQQLQLQQRPSTEMQARELENAIQGKLQFPDDNVQDILDEHVSRVFSDHSLSTATASSPPVLSPRSLSPRRWTQQQQQLQQQLQQHQGSSSYAKPRTRKDRDVFSTFSGDSGNIHDFAEGSEHKMAMVKSKSTPEYADERFRTTQGGGCRRSSSRKTLADLTDSGVSVVSDSASVGGIINIGGGVGPKQDSRVLNWLLDSSDGRRSSTGGHAQSEMAFREGGSSSKSKQQAAHRKGWGSRSSSLERNSAPTGSLGPAQPFVADPSMPPPPPPNTAIQLEEARRRLMEDDLRTRSRQRTFPKYYPGELAPPISSQASTLQRKALPKPVVPRSDEVTTVVFSFCDEQFPYRTKIPGGQITLRQFKEYLPKKGNYRFFFKTICDDEVTHEEVSNDLETLPLWEGKVMAQVKPID